MVKILFAGLSYEINKSRNNLKWLVVLCLLIAWSGKVGAQDLGFLRMAEDSLQKMSLAIIVPSEDMHRLERNQQFEDFFLKVLQRDQGIAWPFDSLKTVAIQTAPDRSFRIITWYVPLAGGRFEYFGFVQVAPKGGVPHIIYPLTDATLLMDDAGFQQLGPDQWLGAWYYELIHNLYQGKDYFTLLGWKGNNPLTRQRLIEPFTLTEDGPLFGAPVFETGSEQRHRIIFEYSAKVAMSLKYEKHPLKTTQEFREMIVFDRLAPTHESLRGHFQYYMPEVNIFDAFVFEEGRWSFVRDVDARTFQR